MGSKNVNAEEPEPDVYSLALVDHLLRVQASGQKMILSATMKNTPRLGDGVSIALLKTLDAKELSNPVTILQFLPIIRDSFSEPKFIAIASNKKPQVTLFFLESLKPRISDSQALAGVAETIDYVKDKTASTQK